MKITRIRLSILHSPVGDRVFNLVNVPGMRRTRPTHEVARERPGYVQVLRVETDEGVEGVCTAQGVVGDHSSSRLRDSLEQLRTLIIGENPLDRARIFQKLHAGTRWVYREPGWFGTADNCLWDIAGKVAGLPVYHLIGRVRERTPCYLNIRGATPDEAAADAEAAVALGFHGVKDHFYHDVAENIRWLQAVRRAVGDDIDCMHDPVGIYTFEEAVRVGHALEDLQYRWFEEPLPERRHNQMKALCDALEIPVLAPEMMMNDVDLQAQWLISGATDLVRANAREGTTALLKLAHMAELHGANVELNGSGGLFGLVHAHLLAGIPNTSYYEYFPGGAHDEVGKDAGLTNPAVPERGYIAPPDGPGWGAEWDWTQFRKRLVTEY